MKKTRRNSARPLEGKLAALVVQGKLLPAAQPGVFKPFTPVLVKGKAVSQIIIDDRR
jgi:hypothetical protein